jgi:hypothetical protein
MTEQISVQETEELVVEELPAFELALLQQCKDIT